MFVTDNPIIHASSLDPEGVLGLAEDLAASGLICEAIRVASEGNRMHRNFALEQRLLRWRNEAFTTLPASAARQDWPPHCTDLFGNHGQIPEVTRDQLSTEALASGILHHGGLLVRGLISPAQVTPFIEGIDQAFDGAQRQNAAGQKEIEPTPWYTRYNPPGTDLIPYTRPWVESAGGVLLADSPRMTFEFIELLHGIGILPMIEHYFGERPTLSIAKSTLRRVPKSFNVTGWHQDGSFLGAGIRSVNLWLCLSHCGETASGLDLIPKRLNHLVETGTHGAPLVWSVGEGMVEIAAGGTPIATPVFKPGDAMLFDELLLHRTSIAPQMLHDRYAIESWFFAPSSYPMQQQPLFV